MTAYIEECSVNGSKEGGLGVALNGESDGILDGEVHKLQSICTRRGLCMR